MALNMKTRRPQRILAVASGGGHWIQMMRLRPCFEGLRVTYATVDPTSRCDIEPAPFYSIPDANRSQKLRLIWLTFRMAWIVLLVRPNVVITTGAAPGYIAIRIAKVIGARAMFLDSVANAEQLSLSAKLSEHHADLLLTQWQQLAKPGGPQYRGSVL